MTKYFSPPDTTEIVPLVGSAIVLTQVDLQKMEGTFKIFESFEKAVDYRHSISKEQFPEFHKEKCDFCRMEAAGM